MFESNNKEKKKMGSSGRSLRIRPWTRNENKIDHRNANAGKLYKTSTQILMNNNEKRVNQQTFTFTHTNKTTCIQRAPQLLQAGEEALCFRKQHIF